MLETGRRSVLLGGLAATLGGASRVEVASSPDAEPHAPFRVALLAFLDGDAARRCRFTLSADVSAPDHTTLHVDGVYPPLWVKCRHDGAIAVGVNWDGRQWDFFAGFDVFPRQVEGGWVRSLSEYEDEGEPREVRPSRADVWRWDGFEVLLRWLNEDVPSATHVELSDESIGITDACLMRDEDLLFGCKLLCVGENRSHVIPLRVG